MIKRDRMVCRRCGRPVGLEKAMLAAVWARYAISDWRGNVTLCLSCAKALERWVDRVKDG